MMMLGVRLLSITNKYIVIGNYTIAIKILQLKHQIIRWSFIFGEYQF